MISVLIVLFTLLNRFNDINVSTYYESLLLAIKYDVYTGIVHTALFNVTLTIAIELGTLC